jgi:hypothetical protein
MLIDDYLADTLMGIERPDLAWAGRDRFEQHRAIKQEQHTAALLRKSQKFVASPLTISTAADLASYQTKKMRDHAQYLHLPAYTTWLDLSAELPAGACHKARRVGVLLTGDNEATILRGEIMIASDLSAHGGYAQLTGRFDLSRGMLWTTRHQDQLIEYRNRGGDPDLLINTVWAAIALINTPRLSVLHHVDYAKLNKARYAKGKVPLLSHSIVRLAIDRGEVGPSASKAKGQAALHHVRAFLRLKRGRVELVRPHWRGDPRFGVIQHRYVAFRAEDEPGPWMGGPAPPPQIIREML